MLMKMFSVYDTLSIDYAPPFLSKNEDTASRSFLSAAKDKENAEDFELRFIGVYDTSTGIITAAKKPLFVTAVDLAESHK